MKMFWFLGDLRFLPFHELGHDVEGVASPDVTDGVAALVGGAVDGVGGAGGPLVVGQRRVGLQGVTEGEEAQRRSVIQEPGLKRDTS